ncbi:MAG TPA: ATP-binding protein [Nitrospiraceae bacterium]|jgi:two-component system phosphate regulon sensor histidine kinase PhoR|nr:ATP-binding protein [Nitrospiraceae bacterium]
MALSIRWKVTIGTLLVLACGLLIAWALAVRFLDQQEIVQSGQILEARTSLVAYGLQPFLTQSGGLSSTPQLQAAVRDLSARALARVTVIAPDGRVLADSAVSDSNLATLENQRARPEIQQVAVTGRGTDLRTSHPTGERTLYLAVGLSGANQAAPTVFLRLGLSMTTYDREVAKLHRDLALAFGIAFLIAIALSVWLAHSITKPLSDIAIAARQLAKGDYVARIRTGSRDEVGLLADTLNHMTDQLRTKIDELSEDRSQLMAMLTSMVEGVMILDRRGRVLQINPALERMFDVTRMEARGQPFSDVFRHPQLDSLVSTVLTKRKNEEDEILLHPSGRRLHIEASVTESDRENEACAVLVFHDMTELRRLEIIRKDFVANVSHELRTPLTSIKGYIEALLDGAKDDPETSTKFLDIILKQSDRLNLILEDLLQLSMIESGQVQFKREPLHIQSVIERTLAMIKPLADKKGHRLVSFVEDNLPAVLSDEDRLIQVLSNLLDNAVKYTPGKGTITIAARPVLDGAEQPAMATAVELSVTDTGIGIPEWDRPRVFERFYRVDKARSRELGGTGLGLAIVRHIVEGLGGRVWVEGNAPIGSRFVVRLPVQQISPPVS